MYKDYGLLKSGFPAESISNGSVLAVKTHEWGIQARKLFAKAILLVRSPSQAIQAEFNRQSGGHIGFASPDRYKRTRGKCMCSVKNFTFKINFKFKFAMSGYLIIEFKLKINTVFNCQHSVWSFNVPSFVTSIYYLFPSNRSTTLLGRSVNRRFTDRLRKFAISEIVRHEYEVIALFQYLNQTIKLHLPKSFQ